MKSLKKVLAFQGGLMVFLAVLGLAKKNKLLKSREAMIMGSLGLLFIQASGLIDITQKIEKKDLKKKGA